MTTDTNLIDVILRDHRRIDRCFQELASDRLRSTHRRDLLDHVIAELVRHAVAEEKCLRPAARQLLPTDDGPDPAGCGLAAYAGAERTMAQLDGLDPHAPAFAGLTLQLATEVRHHVAEVDCRLVPRLRVECPPELLAELGAQMLRIEAAAPTCPHPLAPHLVSSRKLLAPGRDVIGRVRAAIAEVVT